MAIGQAPHSLNMVGHDIIVIGGSKGSAPGLIQLVGGLPADLPAAIFVVMHVPPSPASSLPTQLAGAGPLAAAFAVDGEPIVPGRVYVAPGDRHLHLERGRLRLGHGPREQGHRPAIDPLFRSAADAYGRRVVGIVMSGLLRDGTRGLSAIKSQGGVTIVQDPAEAPEPSMPRQALAHGVVDHSLPIAAIAPVVVKLAREAIEPEEPVPGGPRGPDSDSATRRATAGSHDDLEAALQVARWNLEDRAAEAHRLVEEARRRGHKRLAATLEEHERDLKDHLMIVHRALADTDLVPLRRAAAADHGVNGQEPADPRSRALASLLAQWRAYLECWQERRPWGRSITLHAGWGQRYRPGPPGTLTAAELAGRRERCRDLVRAAAGHLKHLSASLGDEAHVVLLADQDAWILETRGAVRQFGGGPSGFTAGSNWAEARLGTNGIGTALATGEAAVVCGPGRDSGPGQPVACLGVPIVLGGRPIGALGVIAAHPTADPARLSRVCACAAAIERVLDTVGTHDAARSGC